MDGLGVRSEALQELAGGGIDGGDGSCGDLRVERTRNEHGYRVARARRRTPRTAGPAPESRHPGVAIAPLASMAPAMASGTAVSSVPAATPHSRCGSTTVMPRRWTERRRRLPPGGAEAPSRSGPRCSTPRHRRAARHSRRAVRPPCPAPLSASPPALAGPRAATHRRRSARCARTPARPGTASWPRTRARRRS